jgi:integrase
MVMAMAGERRRLRLAAGEDPIWRLWRALPEPWRGPVIGPGIPGWAALINCRDGRRLTLTGIPEVMAAELAWMAHWQAGDGTRVSVDGIGHLAHLLRQATRGHHPVPPSVRRMDFDAAAGLQRWYYATQRGRFPSAPARAKLITLFRFAHPALVAACHDGHWWQLDHWYPRCDRRIPLGDREPLGHIGSSPGLISQPWLREAAKWCLGTMLEAGTLRWGTVSQGRMASLQRFDRWLTATFDDPRQVLDDPAAAAGHAAAFHRWDADPVNRSGPHKRRKAPTVVDPRNINKDLLAIAELFEFVAANHDQARPVLGPHAAAWAGITTAHAASWSRQVTRIPLRRTLGDDRYVDDHALAQITAALPLLGMPRTEQMTITRGDGARTTLAGFGDPQAMRMILVQILTGRRASEILLCDFDCLAPATGRALQAADGEQIARFRYAQSKIDTAPDSILVDSEVVAIIEEQRQWVRNRFGAPQPRQLFLRLKGNRHAAKPYSMGSYGFKLRDFSNAIQIVDSKGRPVHLHHTHCFRHTKLTRLAELGLPIHVLQRYAGHATPSMSMHYIAQRDEHAELAFLATVKLRADGTQVQFSRADHDSLHLFERADRILPHGWCLLPPLQTCSKGNACLTCSVFVTDETHQTTLQRQLADTEQLIARTTADFQQRHGSPMPDDNIWLAQRRAEHAALAQLLSIMDTSPGRAVQGGGCGAAAASGPVPLTLDTSRTRRGRR